MIPDGWCSLPDEGIGNHCFGDFGFPRSVEYHSTIFKEASPYLGNTPLTIMLFIVLKKLSYNFGLIIYLAVLALATMAPIWAGTKGKTLIVRISSSIFLGLLSIGTIAAIDRGNFVLAIIPLAYIFFTTRNKFIRKSCLFLIINLKFWGVLFFLILLSQRRYKEIIIVTFSSAIFNLIILQLLSGNAINALKSIFDSIISRAYGDYVQQYSISIFGFIRRSTCLLGYNQSCNGPYELIPFLALLVFYVFVSIALVLSFVYAKKSELVLSVRYSPTIICTFLLVPEAPIYQISLIIIIVSLLAHERKQFDPIERKLIWALILPLTISTVPIAYNWIPTLLLPPQRYFYWLYPLAWSLVLSYFLFVYLTKLRDKSFK